MTRGKEITKRRKEFQCDTFDPQDILKLPKAIIDYDQIPLQYLGKDAVHNFHDHFRNMIKIKDQNRFHDNSASALTRLFKHSERKLLMPKKLNLVKWRGKLSAINNKGFRIGDQRIGLLAQSL